jgi:GxxExxY protein
MLHGNITSKIIESFYKVYNTLGYGFLEKVYENALKYELLNHGFKVEQQKNIKVFYTQIIAGDYYADLIVNNLVIIELKAAEDICEEHEAQLINYLKATNVEVGLVLNFGKKAKFSRKVFSNERKSV